jgi:glycosyltransferase involved in cell wall biosynthesis
MRIGIFIACAGRQDGGPETFEVGLVRALAGIDRENEYRIFCLSQDAVDACGVDAPNVRFEILRHGSRAAGLTFGLPLALRKSPVDVLHATVYPPLVSPVDYVFTMHDVSPFALPGNYPAHMRVGLRFLIGRGLRRAARVVCVSEHARQSTLEHSGIGADRTTVIHHGIDAAFRPRPVADARATVLERYGIRAPYALYVGKLTAPKNLVRLLEAFAALRRESPELSLVLCGRRFWDSAFLDEAVNRLALRDAVVEPGYVPTEDLPLLYSGAEMLTYVSLFEGFGFPVVEAMACGTPVVTSNVACLPEIAGDAALLVDPGSTEDITSAIRRLHADPDLQSDLSKKGLARAALFSWHRAAEHYLDVYRRTCGL